LFLSVLFKETGGFFGSFFLHQPWS